MSDLNLDGLTDAQKRLFAVRCARRVQHLMTDPRSIAALDVAERHARGEATDEEMKAASAAAWDAADAESAESADSAAWAASVAAWGAADAVWAASAAWAAADAATGATDAPTDVERAAQQEILEQITKEATP